MYCPYLRGKRHELSALRKIATRLDPQKFRPIIEPVKENTKQLISTIKKLNEHSFVPHIIINPKVGELTAQQPSILLSNLLTENIEFIPCVLFDNINSVMSQILANQFITDHVDFSLYLYEGLSLDITSIMNISVANIFKDTASIASSMLLNTPNLVLLNDPFPAYTRNADYPMSPSPFSDAHLTFNSRPNQIGFGDFTIVGESWSESGGPARAVAIHITYIDSNHLNMMFIKHCVSTINSGSTTDPGSKFLEALQQLISFANITPSLDKSTVGFESFLDLHSRNHYPNLGPIKENSIVHHMETITKFL